jgi:hypothetical protein
MAGCPFGDRAWVGTGLHAYHVVEAATPGGSAVQNDKWATTHLPADDRSTLRLVGGG